MPQVRRCASAWLLASIATKSITTPLAMSVSQSLGGIPAIAAAVVVVVGILGALAGYPLLKLMRVTDPEAQGLAMGACAHAIGTAASAEQGVTQGAFSSLAMVVCNMRVNPLGWPLAMASSLLYALLFANSKLYGEAGLQIFFVAMAVWGWWQWLRGVQPDGAGLAPLRAAGLDQPRQRDGAGLQRVVPGHEARHHARIHLPRVRRHQRDVQVRRPLARQAVQHLHLRVPGAQQDEAAVARRRGTAGAAYSKHCTIRILVFLTLP